MPHIWRKFTDGTWRQVNGIWRKFTVPDASGNLWRPITFVWRRNTSGIWQQVFLQNDNLSTPTSGFTFTSNDPSGDFYSGSTLTLRRGTWSNSPTEYRMRIQYGLSENETSGTIAGPVTYTPSNSTASTALTYTLSAFDCLEPSYFFKGTISVDNAAGTNTVTNANQRRGKMNINVFSSGVTSITANGGTANWTADVIGGLAGLGNDTYIDAINLIVYNSSFSIVKQWQHRPNGGTVEAGFTSFTPTKPTGITFSYVFSDPAITSAGGEHTIEIQVIARDTDKTFYYDASQFTPLGNFQATGNQRRTQLPSNFTQGTILYISTNGYIGIGADPGSSISVPGTGLYLMPLAGDQRQTALWTFSDATNFYVRWQGARFSDSTQTIDYQAKFYWNSTNVDVHFVTNNLSSSNPASPVAVLNNGAIFRNWSASTLQSSALISTASMTRNTTQDGVDDNRTAIATVAAPTISSLARADGTITPSQPSVLSFSSSSNQVTTSWTNSPDITSVRFQGSGAGVNTDYVDSTSPFITSDVSDYTSSATYSATVTNSNNALRILVTWTQSNARSYRIYYNSSTQGSDQRIGNFTGTNAEIYFPWSTVEGTFTLTGVSVYSGDNQTGSETFLPSSTPTLTPTAKSSSRSGSVSLTYTASLSSPTPTSVTFGSGKFSINYSGGVGDWKHAWYQIDNAVLFGTVNSSRDAASQTSPIEFTPTFTPTAGSTWYWWVRSATSSTATGSGNVSDWNGPVSVTIPSAGTAPSAPGTPTLTYVSSNNTSTEWGYSATWSNSTSGTTPISYFLKCYGSSDGYVAVQTERGPFSSGSPAVSFRLPITSTFWQVAAFATNSVGTSTDSGRSNTA